MSTDDKTKTRTMSTGEGEDVLLDHNYDGIQEYDNPLPAWWVWIWIGSMAFSALYFVHYQLGHGDSIHDEYMAEVTEFEEAEAKRMLAMGEVSEDSLSSLMASESSVMSGQAVYTTHCKQCHGANGEGQIGPNLTDKHWLHGDGSLMGIYKTVDEGVVEKGMLAWGKKLSPKDLRTVVAYVGSIRGKNLPGKAPEGKAVGGAAGGDDAPAADTKPTSSAGAAGAGE